jgi:hypothetical protein
MRSSTLAICAVLGVASVAAQAQATQARATQAQATQARATNARAAQARAETLDFVTETRTVGSVGAHPWTPRSRTASNIVPADTHADIAPALPPSPAGADAAPSDYLLAARGALATNRTGEAQQSLEMAETRLLTRSVPADQADTPDPQQAVSQIHEALLALGEGHRDRAIQIVDAIKD